MSDLKITDGDDTVEFQLDAALAREADLREDFDLVSDERDNARRNSSAFEERMGNLQVENGELHDQLAALREELAKANKDRETLLKLHAHLRARRSYWIAEETKVRRELTAAEQRNAELEADKSRLDFWQSNPQYAGGFAPSGDWSFFSRELKTCYGKDLRSALDRLQVMHADLTKPTESGADV